MNNNLFKLVVIFMCILLTGCSEIKINEVDDTSSKHEIVEENTDTGLIEDSIDIKKIDESNYEFIYNGETFKVFYTTDMWKIYNSYKITNSNDIAKICRALINIHPIHGSDMVSYRTVSDMTFEWIQHNLAYKILPEDNSFRKNAKDVDLDPKDQGKSLVEMYEDRTGKKLDIIGSLRK